MRHFHTHPHGRLHEILFWGGIGLVLGAVAFFGWRGGWLSTPLALMLAIVAACFVLWAMLPQRKARAPPPVASGKRGEIERQRREIKASRTKKGPGPPLE